MVNLRRGNLKTDYRRNYVSQLKLLKFGFVLFNGLNQIKTGLHSSSLMLEKYPHFMKPVENIIMKKGLT